MSVYLAFHVFDMNHYSCIISAFVTLSRCFYMWQMNMPFTVQPGHFNLESSYPDCQFSLSAICRAPGRRTCYAFSQFYVLLLEQM